MHRVKLHGQSLIQNTKQAVPCENDNDEEDIGNAFDFFPLFVNTLYKRVRLHQNPFFCHTS